LGRFQFLCFLFINLLLFSNQNDSFIKEVREIKIPNYEGAYNPSIIDLGERYLLVFRYDIYHAPVWRYPHRYLQFIGAVFLDHSFSVISEPKLIKELGNRVYDPRVIKKENDIFIIFASPKIKEGQLFLSSQLNLAQLKIQNDDVMVENKTALFVSWQKLWEKNWAPFFDRNRLLLSYSINPHLVVEPLEGGECEKVTQTKVIVDWPYGEIRGGTPGILDGDEYLGFFHSSATMEDQVYRYFIGAYRFDGEFPFKLKAISQKPFEYFDFYTTKKSPLTSADVVFPGGFIIKENKIFLIYGENDTSIKLITIDKNELMNQLKPIR
jgi:predicted GH43/DUF377 family glycosyl hydrolase